MKRLLVLVAATCFVASVSAGSIAPEKPQAEVAKSETVKKEQAKQCLNELSPEEQIEKDRTQEKSWLRKIAKYHKLGTLHFQDIIEIFH